MRRLATQLQGCIYLLPGQARWLVADLATSGGPRIEDGGLRDVAEAIFPPPPESLAELLADRSVAWSIVVPIPVRTALVHLPDLGDEELARGVPWEAERVFQLADQDPLYDYELLDTPPTVGQGRLSLLVAMRRAVAEHWREWAARLPNPPARLEPSFTAGLRQLRARPADGGNGPCVHIHQDEGSAVVLILDENGVPLSARNLAVSARRRGEPAPLSGEDGIRALRETILECEDRFPHLALQNLSAVGQFDADWLGQASFACQLPLVDPRRAPAGVPATLTEEQRWLVPYGGLLGF